MGFFQRNLEAPPHCSLQVRQLLRPERRRQIPSVLPDLQQLEALSHCRGGQQEEIASQGCHGHNTYQQNFPCSFHMRPFFVTAPATGPKAVPGVLRH